MKRSPIMTYFGANTVEAAISDYFKRHGLTEDNRDNLMYIAVHMEDDFFQIVEDFVMKTN